MIFDWRREFIFFTFPCFCATFPAVVGVVLLVGVVLYYRRKKKEEEQLMFAMVEKITSE